MFTTHYIIYRLRHAIAVNLLYMTDLLGYLKLIYDPKLLMDKQSKLLDEWFLERKNMPRVRIELTTFRSLCVV